MRRMWRALRLEPLVWFAVLGTLAFGAMAWRDARNVEIPESQFELASERMRAWLATSTLDTAHQAEADARVVGDELLYREALRLGLERDDPVIRERLAQKLLLITEESHLAQRTPTDKVLRDLHLRHAEQWLEPARTDFCQIFFRSPPEPAVLRALLHRSLPVEPDRTCDPVPAGDSFALGRRLLNWSDGSIRDRFGEAFAVGLAAAPMQRWSGPLQSNFGTHYVLVLSRTAAHRPGFGELRPALLQLWERNERLAARNQLLASLAERYRTTATRGSSADVRRRVEVATTALSEGSR